MHARAALRRFAPVAVLVAVAATLATSGGAASALEAAPVAHGTATPGHRVDPSQAERRHTVKKAKKPKKRPRHQAHAPKSAAQPPSVTPTLPVATGPLVTGIAMGDRLGDLSDADLAAALDDVVALHAGWIRMDVSWARVQPSSAAGYDWARTDRVVAAARSRGIQVLGIVTYSPAWARSSGCDSWNCPPDDPGAFAGFAASVAARYAAQGMGAVEIWNEPNLSIFWRDPDPARYGALLQAAVSAVHGVDPALPVLSGGLAAIGTWNGSYGASDFLSAACAASRCAGIAAVSYHPYTTPYLAARTSWVSAWDLMRRDGWGQANLLAAMTADGLAGTPIWVTEYGAPTGGHGAEAGSAPTTYSESYDHVSEALQAQIVASGFDAARADPGLVKAFFVHTWEDTTRYGGDREDYFGLRRSDGSAKPAWYAFAQNAAG